MRNFITLSCLVLCVGCGRDAVVERELSHAEEIMYSSPDSALHIIRNIGCDDLFKRSTRARYAVLYSQALDKNGIDLLSDSLILPATEYYRHHGEPADKAECWYYLARIHENKGEIDNAIGAYAEAERCMTDPRTRWLRAMLYANVGNLYAGQESYDEAGKMYDKAIEAYRGLNTVNEAYAMSGKADVLHLCRNYEQALAVLDQAAIVAARYRDSACLLNIAHSRAAVMSDMDDRPENLERVIRLVSKICDKYNKGVLDAGAYPLLSDCYYRMGRLDSAGYYAAKALDADRDDPTYRTIGLYAMSARICEARDEYAEANSVLYRWIDLADSLNLLDRANLVQDLEEKYAAEYLRYSYNKLRFWHVAISVFSVLLIVIVGCVAWIVSRRRRAQMNEYCNFADSLKRDYSSLQERYAALENELGQYDDRTKQLFAALDTRLKSLQKMMEMAGAFEGNPAVFYEKFRKYFKIENNRSDKALGDIYNIANLYYGGIIDYLQMHYPGLNDEDLALCCMICLGFSPQQTRLLFNHTNSCSIYTKRSKLRRKLGISDADNLEEFFADCIERNKTP